MFRKIMGGLQNVIADALWGALRIVSKKLFTWLTDPQRWQRIRFRHRQMWWRQYLLAKSRNKWWRLRLAECYAIAWKFEKAPLEARTRGDLHPRNAKAPQGLANYKFEQ